MIHLAGAIADATDRLTIIIERRDVIKQILVFSKERMAATFTRSPPIFHVEDLVYLSTLGLHICSQKCVHLRGQKLGSFKVMAKVGMTSYKLLSLDGCRFQSVFHCDLLSNSKTSSSLRPHQAEIGNIKDYLINFIDDVKIDIWPRRRDPYMQFFYLFC